MLIVVNSGLPSERINLSPFTKDFRGGGHSNEYALNLLKPLWGYFFFFLNIFGIITNSNFLFCLFVCLFVTPLLHKYKFFVCLFVCSSFVTFPTAD